MGADGTNDDVRRAIAALRSEVDRDLALARELAPVGERAYEVDELVTDLDRQLERVQAAAVITLVGSTGAGKSSLLNALVGRRIANEGENRPTTAVPVIYRPRDADLRDLVEGLPGEAPDVVDYDPDAGGMWSDQILVDAPDTNSVAVLHREVVATLAARSDVLVVVAHRQSVSELASVEFVDAFAGRRGMLFVLNRADELTGAAQAELLSRLRDLAGERWGAPDAPVIATSAKLAQSDPGTPGWGELEGELSTLVRTGRLGRVRRHNAIGTAGRLGSLFEQLRAGTGEALSELERSVREGLERWADRVDAEIAERLALRRAALRGLLWNEAARHWDGPGGWALRAGGLSALGLGAGAALARRNPVLAAGAAAGAFAADRVRGALRERSFSDSTGLLPGEGELESWYRAELGEARLVALRLGGEPTALGVPDSDDLARRAGGAVSEAWERLVERDLLAAAASSVRWWVRWPVDLPVYAVVGWVVWRAAEGFFSGDYVGFDFLVNAALVLGAWLFVARSLVRVVLGRKSAGLLAGARATAAESLRSRTAECATEGLRGLADRRAALERLAGVEKRWKSRLLGE